MHVRKCANVYILLLARASNSPLTFFGNEKEVTNSRCACATQEKNGKTESDNISVENRAVCQTEWLTLMCVGAVDSTKFNGWELFYLSTGLASWHSYISSWWWLISAHTTQSVHFVYAIKLRENQLDLNVKRHNNHKHLFIADFKVNFFFIAVFRSVLQWVHWNHLNRHFSSNMETQCYLFMQRKSGN